MAVWLVILTILDRQSYVCFACISRFGNHPTPFVLPYVRTQLPAEIVSQVYDYHVSSPPQSWCNSVDFFYIVYPIKRTFTDISVLSFLFVFQSFFFLIDELIGSSIVVVMARFWDIDNGLPCKWGQNFAGM
jgi:hypothetical protein